MVSDPAGYFVVYPDRSRGLLSLEHYGTDGLLRHVIEGATAAELYTPAVATGLVSRLDHAAYLGRELARAERSLADGTPYVQDAAAERQSQALHKKPLGLPAPAKPACGCGPTCGGT